MECSLCNVIMSIEEDEDGKPYFYLCPECGYTSPYGVIGEDIAIEDAYAEQFGN